MKKTSTLLFISLLCSFMLDAQGVFQLWGMTYAGGGDNTGAIFTTNSAGNNFQGRYQFSNLDGGAYPQYSDPIEYNGKFYGMTEQGGINNVGVIFEWDPATNIYTRKIDFNNTNGGFPFGSLTMSNGKFYGMTYQGGTNDVGVIFEWDPATNVYNKKIDLNYTDGEYPYGSLTMSGGKFYGMTQEGGNFGVGVIFEWDPATNVYTKKIDLNYSDGGYPTGNLTLSGGKFYGMTQQGGNFGVGVIFEWDPAINLYTKKIDFDYNTNGGYPIGSLTLNSGKLYGMASQGGVSGGGVIFEWDPATNLYTDKIDFDYTNGGYPLGNLTFSGGSFYGMTYNGGFDGSGVVFEWDPATNVYTKMMDFTNSIGVNPSGSLTLSGGKFYGLTQQGGNAGTGVIFEWDPAINVYTKKIDLNGANFNGISPYGSLALNGGKFYGTAFQGGSNNVGAIFEWDPATNTYSKKFDFNYPDGGFPKGKLILSGGKFYGMTYNGGSNSVGVIFEWDPATNVYTKKIDLSDADGSYPVGNLTLSDGKFYGMTQQGGNNGAGVIFEWDPATNIYTRKIDLIDADGNYPVSSLTLSEGKFYGMTYNGGSYGAGVIFEWDPATNIYTKKIDLNYTDGGYPSGNLVLNNGNFYGTTEQGGINGAGVIFEWDPATNVYNKKIDFLYADGAYPVGNLTLSGGKFYGMTRNGGDYDAGTIFEWDPASNVYTVKDQLNGTDGGYGAYSNDLVTKPVPVASGTAGSCTGFPDITIDNTNNNIWVPIVDNIGDVVAEIKANGNNLGIVNSSMYINNAAVREDGDKVLYLDRNITLTPAVQPASAVDIRLYIKSAEYLALKNAFNSIAQPSGITTINDIEIFKTADNCLAATDFIVNPVAATPTDWEADYVFTASISSFSSFYFAKSTLATLPYTLLEFKGRLLNNDGVLNWKTTDEVNTLSFDIERSTDGRNYSRAGNVVAFDETGVHSYNYTDKNITSLNVPVVYYRLKQIDIDGRFTYSRIVAVSIDNARSIVLFYPNPVINEASLTVTVTRPGQLQARIIDNAGRVVKQQQWILSTGSTSLSVDVKGLTKGIYYLELKGEMINERQKFVKQ
jgi:uncharacterized repeat protein (TIGR03803 family)